MVDIADVFSFKCVDIMEVITHDVVSPHNDSICSVGGPFLWDSKIMLMNGVNLYCL